jgi:hypothetical protein
MTHLYLDILIRTKQVITIHINNLSQESLISALDYDYNKDQYYLLIKFPSTKLSKTLFNLLDYIMSPRLWWILKQYFIDESLSIQSLLFERVSRLLEKSLLVLFEKNYPSNSKLCADRPLAVGNIRGDTWGNRAINTMGFLSLYTQYVTYLHSTQTGSVNDPSSFASAGECQDKINKHECLFLSSTNCTLPISLNSPEDVKILSDARSFRMEYSNASEFGTPIPLKRPFLPDKFPDLKRYEVDDDVTARNYLLYTLNTSYYYFKTGTVPIITTETSIRQEGKMRNPSGVKQLFGYVHRCNAEFRWKIQHVIDRFRATSQPPFLPNITCVMVHIRKDDRSIPHIDMVEWCKNHVVYNITTNQYSPVGFVDNKSSVVVESSLLSNLGCGLTLPYGAATIEHFINASLLIQPNIRNMFITTDDEIWLGKYLSEYKLLPGNLINKYNFHIYSYHARHNHRHSNSMEVAADFFATIELGQQCSGFVGYSSTSAVARLFYESLCFYNHNVYLSCPPLYDMSGQIF